MHRPTTQRFIRVNTTAAVEPIDRDEEEIIIQVSSCARACIHFAGGKFAIFNGRAW